MAKIVPVVSVLAVFLMGCATHHAAPPPEVRYVEVPAKQEPVVATPPPAPVVEPAPAPAPPPKPAPPKARKSTGGAAALKESQW